MLFFDAVDGMMTKVFMTAPKKGVSKEETKIFSIIVPRAAGSEVERLHDLAIDRRYASRAPRGPLKVSGSWMVDNLRREAILEVDPGRLAPAFRVRLALMDPDWRRYLLELHAAGLWVKRRIKIYASESEMLAASAALKGDDETTFDSLGIEVFVRRFNALKRVRPIADSLDERERRAQPVGGEIGAEFIRHQFPLIADINLERGGAIGAIIDGYPVVLIDLAYENDGWSTSALDELVDVGLHKISDVEKAWGLASGWGFILFPQHLSIFVPSSGLDGEGGQLVEASIRRQLRGSQNPRRVDVSNLAREASRRFLSDPSTGHGAAMTLYSGSFSSNQEFVKACGNGLLNVAVGNFRFLNSLSRGSNMADSLAKVLKAATAFQQVAAGTVAGFVDAGDAREALVNRELRIQMKRADN